MLVIARQALVAGLPRQGHAARRRRRSAGRDQLVLEKISTEHGTTEDLVKDATATVARIKAFIRRAQTSFGCPSPTSARSSRCPNSSAATPWPT